MGLATIKALYTDGGLIGQNPSPLGGAWAYRALDRLDTRPMVKGMLLGGVNAEDEPVAGDSGLIELTPGKTISNNVVELIAAVKALEFVGPGWSGTLYSDSEVTLGRLFRRNALNGVPANVAGRLMVVLRQLGDVKGVLLQGHPTKKDLREGFGKKRGFPVSKINVMCDVECNRLIKEWRAVHGL